MNIVAHNMMAMNASRQYNIVNNSKTKSTEKLSSGYRINRAADDAAGLSISENMRHAIRGLNRGADNIQDGISLCQTADGALAEVHNILQRVNELAVQSANGINSDQDRQAIQNEIDANLDEIDRIALTTTFNDQNLFDAPTGAYDDGAITKLVSSPAADSHYLTESYYYSGKYYPSASLDFSAVNSTNISRLNGGNFYFTCSADCDEVFDITFKTDGDGTQSSATNLKGQVRHKYVVDISDCKNGSQVVDKIYSIVQKYPRTPECTSSFPGLTVSHSNNLIKDGSSLIVARNYDGYTSQSAAESAYINGKNGANSGYISYSELTAQYAGATYDFTIQCSSNDEDQIHIKSKQMNATTIGIRPSSVRSYSDCLETIDKCSGAIATISEQRASWGSYQNRLESSFNNNEISSENLQSAESLLRDTDMSEEMVKYSMQNILSQSAQSMLANANTSAEDVLRLLQ